ncbi:MAG: site-specific DNA-methyltransferase, partial [Planctomycetota bacterium]
MALSSNRLHQGDCIEGLKQVEPGSVDLVFADPPFNIGYDYDQYDDQRSEDDYLNFCQSWIQGVHQALKPTGTFWLAIGDEYAAELKVLSKQLGFTCRSWVIWYYTFGVNCRKGFSRSHTHLFHFVKDAGDFTFNAENPAVRIPSARQLVYADARANSKGRLPDNTWILRPQDAPSTSFAPWHDTWYYARVAGTFKEREGFHGCQMPEQLLGRIIRISTDPGDLVLDPFGGSGTTLAVAKKLGRRWVGFELSDDYANRVEQRLDQCEPGDPLDGAEDPLRSAPKTSQGKTRTQFKEGRPLIPLDDAMRTAITDAYLSSGNADSLRHLICDAERNAAFISHCKSARLLGDGRTWNEMLLQMGRRQGLLGPTNRRSRPSLRDQDAYSDAAEVAMKLMALDYALTPQQILCTPDAAAEFDQLAGLYAWAGESAETPNSKASDSTVLPPISSDQSFAYRNAVWQLERVSVRTRKQAIDRPKAVLVDGPNRVLAWEELAGDVDPGAAVYVIADQDGPLYVGETLDLAARMKRVQMSAAWQRWQPKTVHVYLRSNLRQRWQLRADLIDLHQPLLNLPIWSVDVDADSQVQQ